ncbi:MAG: 3-ketoacyl-CoA thiolase [Syntrophus sp. SKADARSKE-3]|nr:3-ketoacyl-CoA thiolase [Syntrophus sp. SKADARSKE-3]
MDDVVIVSACRTAIGAFGGSLKNLNGATIASVTMREAVKRAGIDAGLINDVRYGCCLEHHDALNTARVASLMAGIPDIHGRDDQPGLYFWDGSGHFGHGHD